ncbi:MAG: putative Fe-S cluster assembly protein SufT [Ilumatobacteraceae bacterium]
MSPEPITLTRDCLATTVPYGERALLPAGALVQMVQTLGDSFTVRSERGALLRIDGHDADALGLDAPVAAPVGESEHFSMDLVVDALRTVFDPEIPINILDLGLVYRCDEEPLPDGGRRISIDMSMTAPGCGMGDVLRSDAEKAVGRVPGVEEVDVTLVWDPPWSIGMLTESARLELGMM